jgi:hypothetical protein
VSRTQAPRGMLKGTQARIERLESKALGTTLVLATAKALATAAVTTLAYSTDVTRKKRWWEQISFDPGLRTRGLPF